MHVQPGLDGQISSSDHLNGVRMPCAPARICESHIKPPRYDMPGLNINVHLVVHDMQISMLVCLLRLLVQGLHRSACLNAVHLSVGNCGPRSANVDPEAWHSWVAVQRMRRCIAYAQRRHPTPCCAAPCH